MGPERPSVYTGRMPRHADCYRSVTCAFLLIAAPLLGGCGQTGRLFLRMQPATFPATASPPVLNSPAILAPPGSTAPGAATTPAPPAASAPQP